MFQTLLIVLQKQEHLKIPSKQSSNEAIADITVGGETKMCVVSVSLTTNGICFEDTDD
jgi:hypothetical protein